MKRQKKINNKGMSLTELIVVMAVMGVVSVGSVIGLGLLHSASAKEAATKLNSALNKTRTECMSKSSASVEIYEDTTDSKYYIVYEVSGNKQDTILIGDKRVSISFKDTMDDTSVISGNSKLIISFNRDTGSFKSISEENTTLYCKEIYIEAGHKTYTIQCERLTGKTTVK